MFGERGGGGGADGDGKREWVIREWLRELLPAFFRILDLPIVLGIKNDTVSLLMITDNLMAW